MTKDQGPACNPHPDAPHGFNRNGSHSMGRYVCDCEGWMPAEQPDCRTCENCDTCKYWAKTTYAIRCTSGNKYKEAPFVVLWRTE